MDAATYCRAAMRELARSAPRLGPPVDPGGRRVPMSSLRAVGWHAAGPVGWLFAAIGGLLTLNRRTQPNEAVYHLTMPGQPRALRVGPAWSERPSDRVDLAVKVDGHRLILSWGVSCILSDNRRTFEERASLLRAGGPWPLDPIADARWISDRVNAILDEREVLLRIVRYDEHGMGGPWRNTLYDVVIPAEPAAVSIPPQYGTKWEEAIVYSWYGARDRQLQPKPYPRPTR